MSVDGMEAESKDGDENKVWFKCKVLKQSESVLEGDREGR